MLYYVDETGGSRPPVWQPTPARLVASYGCCHHILFSALPVSLWSSNLFGTRAYRPIHRAVSRHDLTHQLITRRTISWSFPGDADYPNFHSRKNGCLMRSAFCLFLAAPPRPGGAGLALLTQVGTSAYHQLVSPADLPTRVTC